MSRWSRSPPRSPAAPGTFVLQHTGTMNRGASSLSVTVVPDSGTGQLSGLSGTLAITIVDKQHRYRFESTIADGN